MIKEGRKGKKEKMQLEGDMNGSIVCIYCRDFVIVVNMMKTEIQLSAYVLDTM